jgi:sugar phosphate isomerase/epimerase
MLMKKLKGSDFMAKYGIADYGVFAWYGGFYDNDDRLRIAKDIGFLGVERLYSHGADDTLMKASQLKKLGMDFATCHDENIEYSIKWTAALGGEYIWASVYADEMGEAYLRQLEELGKVCKSYGIKAAVHNHLGNIVEKQETVETVLEKCPSVYLLLDTGHLAVAGGDVKYIADTYYDRIAAYHLKGWEWSATPNDERWYKRGRFCGIGEGNFKIDNEWVFKNALKRGFDGWIHIEHDTHLREPALDLKESFDILKKWESEI